MEDGNKIGKTLKKSTSFKGRFIVNRINEPGTWTQNVCILTGVGSYINESLHYVSFLSSLYA